MKNSLAYTLITLYIVAFVGFAGFSFMFPVIPLYATELGASVSQVGVIVATTSYVAAFFLIPFGMLSDRFGRQKLLLGGLLVFTLTPLLYPLAHSTGQLILVRAIHGLAAAAFLPTAIALVVDLTPYNRRGTAIGWYTASLQLGLMAGPITGGFLASRFGYNAAFYGCAAISFVGLALAFSRLRDIAQEPVVTPEVTISPWGWLGHPLAIAVMLAPLLVALGSGTIGSYIPLYGLDFGMTEADAGAIITAVYASSAVLRAPAGRLADRVDRKLLLIGGVGLSAIAVSLFSFFHGLPQFILIGIIFGIGMGIAMPASLVMAADFSSASGRGVAMAIPTCFFQVGLALGPTIMGSVAQMSGFKMMFLACAASLAFGLLIMVGLMRVQKVQS
ncbi:MAG: MFS transporter [Dehalococcoidia bacterium]|nr:MFS transporter [Dehalococcoidia bacterium]